MNVRLVYLYCDAGNYKRWGEVVFVNSARSDPPELAARIGRYLIDGHWFVASEVGLPDLRPTERDDELDHDWHEFHSLTATRAAMDDPAGRDVCECIRDLRGAIATPHRFAHR